MITLDEQRNQKGKKKSKSAASIAFTAEQIRNSMNEL